MLFSMQLLCYYKKPPALFTSLPKQLYQGIFKDRRSIRNPFSSCCRVHALKDDDSKQYEIDPEKAKEALKELDKQIQSVSNKQVSSPKLTATVSDEKSRRDQINDTAKLEILESFLPSLAGGLVLFTIFYNVLFYTVIKPSIDGP